MLFSTHVWILTHMYGKRHTCVKKATQLYVCKCLPFTTHVWEKPLTCLFPPELSVNNHQLYPYWLTHTRACWTILPSMASLDGWLTTINQPPLHTIQKAPESPLEMARADSGLLCLLHQYKGGLPLQNSASTNQPKLRSQLSDIINSSRKKNKVPHCVSKTSYSC